MGEAMTAPYTEQERECVDRGAAFLDEHVPHWWDVVDVLDLDMGSPCQCVLGQLYGGGLTAEPDCVPSWVTSDYTRAGLTLGIYRCEEETEIVGCVEGPEGVHLDEWLGFDTSIVLDTYYYGLQARWSELIRERRNREIS